MMGGGGRGGGRMGKNNIKKFPQDIINKKYIPTDTGQKYIFSRREKKCCIS